MNKLITRDWFLELTSEVKTIITESVFISRWTLIEAYHQIGGLILKAAQEQQISYREILQGLAKELQKSERTLYYAVEFVEKYPKLDEIPEGKNISWNKLITKYLVGESKKEGIIQCKHCPLHCNGNVS